MLVVSFVFLPVLRNLLLSLSDGSPIIFSMSWENNQIGRTRKRRVFVGKLCAVFHHVWLVHVQAVSGDAVFPLFVRLRQTEPVAFGLCESLVDVCSPGVCKEIASKELWG